MLLQTTQSFSPCTILHLDLIPTTHYESYLIADLTSLMNSHFVFLPSRCHQSWRSALTFSVSLSRSCVLWMTPNLSYGAPCLSTTFSVVSETKSSSRATGASHRVPQPHHVPFKPQPQIHLFPLLPCSRALHHPGRIANACVC